MTERPATPTSKRRVTLPDPKLFPAQPDVRPRPKWYIRLRGFLSLAALVAIGGIGLAVAVALLLALIAILSVAFLT